VDDLGWSDLGCNGSEVYLTPNVDRLASQGTWFSDFYAGGPVCSPTRASILTGRSPARLGLTTYLLSPERDPAWTLHHLAPEEVTVAEALREHGWATGYFGKWHLGYAQEHWAAEQGFDVAIGGMDLPWAWRAAHPDRQSPMEEGHTRFFSPYHLTFLENGPEGEYLTERLTDETIGFIEEHRDEPFFALLSFHTVHTPLQAKPEVIEAYRARIEALGLAGREETDRRHKRWQNDPRYAAMVHHMDQNVGRLLARLDELGLARDTIVVFTSDNGGKGSVTSNLPLRGAKHELDEGGIRVPLVVRWPGRVPAGGSSSQPLITHDIFPTLLELAGLPPRPDEHLDGTSFAGILVDGDRAVEREALYWHNPHGRFEAAVRRGDHKLLHFFREDRMELYDLARDPGETDDLSETHPEMASALLQMLRDWQASAGARFPPTAR